MEKIVPCARAASGIIEHIMKLRTLTILAACLVFSLVWVKFSYAFSPRKAFGGKIISTQNADITCTAQVGPMLIVPSNTSPAGFYVIRYTTKNVTQNKWILGMYNSTVDTQTCYSASTETPVPVFIINPSIFGVSGR